MSLSPFKHMDREKLLTSYVHRVIVCYKWRYATPPRNICCNLQDLLHMHLNLMSGSTTLSASFVARIVGKKVTRWCMPPTYTMCLTSNLVNLSSENNMPIFKRPTLWINVNGILSKETPSHVEPHGWARVLKDVLVCTIYERKLS